MPDLLTGICQTCGAVVVSADEVPTHRTAAPLAPAGGTTALHSLIDCGPIDWSADATFQPEGGAQLITMDATDDDPDVTR